MDIVKVAAIGIVAGVLAMAIRKTNPEIAMQLSIATGLLILLMVVEYLGEATEFLRELQDNMGDAYDAIGITIKIVGIAYISEFSTQALKDAGEANHNRYDAAFDKTVYGLNAFILRWVIWQRG